MAGWPRSRGARSSRRTARRATTTTYRGHLRGRPRPHGHRGEVAARGSGLPGRRVRGTSPAARPGCTARTSPSTSRAPGTTTPHGGSASAAQPREIDKIERRVNEKGFTIGSPVARTPSTAAPRSRSQLARGKKTWDKRHGAGRAAGQPRRSSRPWAALKGMGDTPTWTGSRTSHPVRAFWEGLGPARPLRRARPPLAAQHPGARCGPSSTTLARRSATWPIRYRSPTRTGSSCFATWASAASRRCPTRTSPASRRTSMHWSWEFAADVPEVLWSGTFFPEDGLRRTSGLVDAGVELFSSTCRWRSSTSTTRCSTRSGVCSRTPHVPILLHAGSMPVGNDFTGPASMQRLLERHPRLPHHLAHMGAPEVEASWPWPRRYERVRLDTTMVFTDFGHALPRRLLPRLADLSPRCCSAPTSRRSPTPTRTSSRAWSASTSVIDSASRGLLGERRRPASVSLGEGLPGEPAPSSPSCCRVQLEPSGAHRVDARGSRHPGRLVATARRVPSGQVLQVTMVGRRRRRHSSPRRRAPRTRVLPRLLRTIMSAYCSAALP